MISFVVDVSKHDRNQSGFLEKKMATPKKICYGQTDNERGKKRES